MEKRRVKEKIVVQPVIEEIVVQPVMKEVVVVEPTVEEGVVAEPTTVEKFIAIAAGEELIALSTGEAQTYIQRGKAYFEARHYAEALREFEALLKIAPGNIENRVWIRKVKEKLAGPEIETIAEEGTTPVAEEVKPKECVWMKMGLVSYRICTLNYDCVNCEFDQTMQERMANGESSELEKVLGRFKELPGNQRICRYELTGDISYRLCTCLFQCTTCEFAQIAEDNVERKLAKLTTRREALRKRK